MVNIIEISRTRTIAPPRIETAQCPRCSGKGHILCPECRGTGEERNVFWVVTGQCRVCMSTNAGFVRCPKCQGEGVVDVRDLPPF
jgi:RecJ-like exonuclease